jgi:hypothetical protein
VVTLILPGYSPHNKEWLEETANSIGGESEIRPIYWGHWTDPEAKFDPKEKAQLLDGVTGKRIVDIIAKSIGTFVTGLIIQKSPEKIRKVILNGICLNDLNENEKAILRSCLELVLPENIICFQNDEDPHGSYEEAKKFLLEVNPEIKVISMARADHEYPYQDEYRKFLLGD